jgi:hypothetical protein
LYNLITEKINTVKNGNFRISQIIESWKDNLIRESYIVSSWKFTLSSGGFVRNIANEMGSCCYDIVRHEYIN